MYTDNSRFSHIFSLTQTHVVLPQRKFRGTTSQSSGTNAGVNNLRDLMFLICSTSHVPSLYQLRLLLYFHLENLNQGNYPGNAACTNASFFIREHSAAADFIQKLCWPLERRQASCGPVSYQWQQQQLLQRLLRLRVRVWLGVDPGHVSEPQKQGHARTEWHPAVQQYAYQREHSELGRLQTLARQDESAAVGEYPLARHVQFSRARSGLQRLRACQLHRIRPVHCLRLWNMQENRVHERARPRLHGLHKRLVATKRGSGSSSRQQLRLVWVWKYQRWCIVWRQLWALLDNKPKLPLLQLRRLHHEPLVWTPRGLNFHDGCQGTVRGREPNVHAVSVVGFSCPPTNAPTTTSNLISPISPCASY